MTTEQKQITIVSIKADVQNGDTLYFIQRHRSASGGSRYYDVYAINSRLDRPSRITWDVAALTGYSYSRKHEALCVKGYGFRAENEIIDAIKHLTGLTDLKEYAL